MLAVLRRNSVRTQATTQTLLQTANSEPDSRATEKPDKTKPRQLGLPIGRRPLSSSFLGVPCRIQKINHKRELLRGLWVRFRVEGLGNYDCPHVLQTRRRKSLKSQHPRSSLNNTPKPFPTHRRLPPPFEQ